MRQKVPYSIAGFLGGMFVAAIIVLPILETVTKKPANQLNAHLWISILILGIIGIFVGLKFDKYIDEQQQ
jgi:hypothetical protein